MYILLNIYTNRKNSSSLVLTNYNMIIGIIIRQESHNVH